MTVCPFCYPVILDRHDFNYDGNGVTEREKIAMMVGGPYVAGVA